MTKAPKSAAQLLARKLQQNTGQPYTTCLAYAREILGEDSDTGATPRVTKRGEKRVRESG